MEASVERDLNGGRVQECLSGKEKLFLTNCLEFYCMCWGSKDKDDLYFKEGIYFRELPQSIALLGS